MKRLRAWLEGVYARQAMTQEAKRAALAELTARNNVLAASVQELKELTQALERDNARGVVVGGEVMWLVDYNPQG